MTQVDRDRLYVHDLATFARRILTYTDAGRDAFLQDQRTQDAVIRCFEVMGEASKRISDALHAHYPEVPWQRIAGFRDVLIHGYDRVDLHYT